MHCRSFPGKGNPSRSQKGRRCSAKSNSRTTAAACARRCRRPRLLRICGNAHRPHKGSPSPSSSWLNDCGQSPDLSSGVILHGNAKSELGIFGPRDLRIEEGVGFSVHGRRNRAREGSRIRERSGAKRSAVLRD